MIRKNTPKNTTLITIILFSILFFAKSNVYAQTKAINPQVLDFDRICAGSGGNEYSATFTYTGFPAGTVFVVELSTNNFVDIITANTISVSDPSGNQKKILFSVPTNLPGSDTYSLRVSTTGFSSSKFVSFGLKNSFPIYYRAHDRQYTINNFSGSAAFCAGGSYTLTIDDEIKNPDSPLKYKFLNYNWYRDNGTTTLPTLVAGASGPSYTVTSPGVYYVETNYGTCSSESYSNRVTVTSVASGSSVTVVSSLGNPFCASTDGTVLTATSGNKYTWKKDGKDFGGNTRTVKATEAGIYTVDVDFGGCVATGSIDLKSNGFTASIDVADEFQLEEGETLSVSVTTDATSPTYEWYLNNNLISGATSGSYLVAAIGTYKVRISQSSGCISSKEFIFQAKGKAGPSSVIPNIISLSGASPYWNIPDEYKNANTKVMIISSNGDMVLDVNNYQGDWPQTSINFKNVNPVYYYVIKGDAGEKKGSITVIR
ncbi:hypothetical protein B0A67_07350 [Flavobacterium aquidurense]|uniref:gliding motility protein SprC n=1 Tax=Flavobacterium aquidurense TaxID=362413 RepID=UPI00092387F1|nr:gliding motility protein SprC [Flavobacterium aquidurense]OXA72350.1 hypothetical protein B0A67_07350 [Flavobacterium aquidurense]SHG43618.1 hypothetical protein SAMN05444481_104220 [Flavobacterium frigidimaris]